MKCPKCGGPTDCLSGCSAHPGNWYCEDEEGCGWEAWKKPSKTGKPVATEGISIKQIEEALGNAKYYNQRHADNWEGGFQDALDFIRQTFIPEKTS